MPGPPLSFGATDTAAKLALRKAFHRRTPASSETIKYFNIRHAGKGGVMQSGHPDIVATSIKWSIAKSALAGLGEAALAGAKAALAAFTGGVGLIINKVAGIIELILRLLCASATR